MISDAVIGYFPETADLVVSSSLPKACAKRYHLMILDTRSCDFSEALRDYYPETYFLLIGSDLKDLKRYLMCENCYILSDKTEEAFVQFFYNYLKFDKTISSLTDSNINYSRELNDLRVIDRAKLLLIQYFGFTEKQAHRYIEKQAMDRCISRREVAEEIIKTYT